MVQHVGQHQCEGLVADNVARAPDRMAEPERSLLAREARLAGAGKVFQQRIKLRRLLAAFERRLQLELMVEMILDHALVAAGDEDEMLDARRASLIDDMLDNRPVDDGEHFLGNGLGGGQKTRAETGDWEDGFADRTG